MAMVKWPECMRLLKAGGAYLRLRLPTVHRTVGGSFVLSCRPVTRPASGNVPWTLLPAARIGLARTAALPPIASTTSRRAGAAALSISAKRTFSRLASKKGKDRDDHDDVDKPSDIDKPGLSARERMRLLVKDYGKVTIGVYLTYDLLTLGMLYSLVKAGVDVTALLTMVGLGQSKWATSGASTLVVVFAANKLLAPVRVLLTVATTPYTVKFLQQYNYLKPRPTPTMKEMKQEYHGVKRDLQGAIAQRRAQATRAMRNYQKRLENWKKLQRRKGPHGHGGHK